MEDHALDLGRQEAGQGRRTEHAGDHGRRHEQDVDPAADRSEVEGGPGSTTVGVQRDPDRRHEDLARVGRAPAGEQPGLGSMEGHGQVGPDRRIRRLAAGQVDGRRRVHGDDRDAPLARRAR